jgi:predicted AlkP superfamily phosphohydrolase/phosphomutase
VSAAVRVLCLGIDAGSRDLIEAWAAAGVLPTFRALMTRGLVGNTESVDGLYVGATWPSFYTGVSPARHGIHGLVQLRPGTYDLYRCYTGEFVKREPFWNHLSRAGRRVAICDVPLTGVSTGLNGIQLVEWGSHDANYGFEAWPRSLKQEVQARFGAHPVPTTCDADHRSPAEFADFTRRLIAGARKKAALTRYYLERGEWDFFMQVFTEGHCAGHQCWHMHDRRCPGWDDATIAETGDPIREVYVAIDDAVADILSAVDGRTLIVLLASHGMSYRFGAQFLLNEILVGLGAAAPASPRNPPGPLERALRRGWTLSPDIVRRPIRVIRDRVRRSELPSLPPEARNGRCFPQYNGLAVGGIRLNLVGREPAGLLAPDSEHEFCQSLTRDLLEIVDADSGQPVVERVIRTADLFRGEYLHHLPDLLVAWSDTRPLGSTTTANGRGAHVRLSSRKLGTVEGSNQYCRSGDHRREGLFVAVGPSLTPSRMSRTVSIMDFAPTFARLLGVELPDADGAPINELL